MGTVHSNYFVSNEYLFHEKPYLHEALDLFTLPVRMFVGGQTIDLKGRFVRIEPHALDVVNAEESPYLSMAFRVGRFGALAFCTYFFRFSTLVSGAVVFSGAIALKYFFESDLIRQRLMQIQVRLEKEKALNEAVSISLDTTGLPKPKGLHPHKSAIYDKMKGSKSSIEDQEIRLAIYPFDRNTVKDKLIFPKFRTELNARSGIKDFFAYPESSTDTQQWTANFSTPELFAHATGEDLTQDELQVMEHPGLYHIKSKIEQDKPEIRELRGDQIALITGAKRYGEFAAHYCYGKDFAKNDLEHVKGFAIALPPKESRIFCMAAPQISSSENGKPYKKEDLEALFYRAFHAFSRIKQQANPQKVHIHTGNWGCGVSGHDPLVVALMQIAAAHLAKVDSLDYYPLDDKVKWDTAIYYYQDLKSKHSTWTVDQFLTEMATDAERKGFVYRSNRD